MSATYHFPIAIIRILHNKSKSICYTERDSHGVRDNFLFFLEKPDPFSDKKHLFAGMRTEIGHSFSDSFNDLIFKLISSCLLVAILVKQSP